LRQKQKKLIMLPSETMIWQPEFTDKTLSRKPGAVHHPGVHPALSLVHQLVSYKIVGAGYHSAQCPVEYISEQNFSVLEHSHLFPGQCNNCRKCGVPGTHHPVVRDCEEVWLFFASW
ncbi:hypothetical protein, partial [Escherichia coli]|uniref:hypothetical protein n=1 Tax=Escherichia coli TaxID=562 RepID=UPI0012FFE4A0